MAKISREKMMCGSRGYPLERYERRWAQVHRWKTGHRWKSGQHFHGKEGRLQVWPRDLDRKLWRWMLAEEFFCMLVFLVLICWEIWPSAEHEKGMGRRFWRFEERGSEGWKGNYVREIQYDCWTAERLHLRLAVMNWKLVWSTRKWFFSSQGYTWGSSSVTT